MHHAEAPDIRKTSVAKVREMVVAALAGSGAGVWLFGSCARGDAGHLSDIDVAVESATPLPLGLLAELREALEESTIPYRVEIVDLRDAGPDYRQSVIAEGIRWSA